MASRFIQGTKTFPLVSGPCVYFLLDEGQVVYVGQTVRLWLRLPQHQAKRFDEVKFITVDENQLDVAEQAFIAYYQPRLNRTPIVYGLACERFLLAKGLNKARVRRLRRFMTTETADQTVARAIALTTRATTSSSTNRTTEG